MKKIFYLIVSAMLCLSMVACNDDVARKSSMLEGVRASPTSTKIVEKFTDEDNNEFNLEIISFFNYQGQDFALTINPEEKVQKGNENLYVFEVYYYEDGTEYIAVEDQKLLDELIKFLVID